MSTVVTQRADRLQGRRHLAGRLGPQRNLHRRARDARPDVHPQEVREGEAARRRAHHRLAAHDHSDRGADRDAGGPRRERALGELQHLLHAGPRRRRHRRGRRSGVRLEGRDRSKSTGGARTRPSAIRGGKGPRAGRRRRRRRHAADPQRLRTRERQRLGQHPVRQPRREGHQGPAEEGPRRESAALARAS